LQQYQGSFVVVSHNRHFVNQIANKIWYIEDQQIKEYPGTYDEYEYWRKQNELKAAPQPAPVKKTESKPQPKPVNTINPNEKRIKALNQDLKKQEDLIEKLESEKQKIETEMAKPEVFSDFTKLAEVQKKFDALHDSLHAENMKWEKIMLEVDQLEASS
jgi:ATP-binding cassette subfamily F protein 3